jgi:hypothetical protein
VTAEAGGGGADDVTGCDVVGGGGGGGFAVVCVGGVDVGWTGWLADAETVWVRLVLLVGAPCVGDPWVGVPCVGDPCVGDPWAGGFAVCTAVVEPASTELDDEPRPGCVAVDPAARDVAMPATAAETLLGEAAPLLVAVEPTGAPAEGDPPPGRGADDPCGP